MLVGLATQRTISDSFCGHEDHFPATKSLQTKQFVAIEEENKVMLATEAIQKP